VLCTTTGEDVELIGAAGGRCCLRSGYEILSGVVTTTSSFDLKSFIRSEYSSRFRDTDILLVLSVSTTQLV
jgi:hypothetical protein